MATRVTIAKISNSGCWHWQRPIKGIYRCSCSRRWLMARPGLSPMEMTLPQGKERWLVVRTADGLKRAQSTLSKQVDKHLQSWEKKLWHVSTQTFETQQDAQDAWQRELKGKPAWLQVKAEMVPYTVTTTTEHVWKMDHRYNTLATVQ